MPVWETETLFMGAPFHKDCMEWTLNFGSKNSRCKGRCPMRSCVREAERAREVRTRALTIMIMEWYLEDIRGQRKKTEQFGDGLEIRHLRLSAHIYTHLQTRTWAHVRARTHTFPKDLCHGSHGTYIFIFPVDGNKNLLNCKCRNVF